jgi:hypothetical protein
MSTGRLILTLHPLNQLLTEPTYGEIPGQVAWPAGRRSVRTGHQVAAVAGSPSPLRREANAKRE